MGMESKIEVVIFSIIGNTPFVFNYYSIKF